MDLDTRIALALGMERLARLRAEHAAEANYAHATELQRKVEELTPKETATRKKKVEPNHG